MQLSQSTRTNFVEETEMANCRISTLGFLLWETPKREPEEKLKAMVGQKDMTGR